MSNSDEKPTETRDIDDLLATCDPLESFDPELTTDAPPSSPASVRIGRGNQPPEDLETTCDQQDRLIIDRICDAFEAQWQTSDNPPNLESFLPDDVESHLRQIIARELVRIDVAERQRSGSSIGKKEYLKRLPEFEDDIELAFSLADSGQVRQATKVNSGAGHRGDVAMPRENDPKARYQATEMHARGGLGAVYRARDRELKRVVALKEILPEHRDKEQYQEKFIFEAEVTGSLEHPGIVPIYGLGRYSDNQPYYAMRFIRGRSFSAVIKSFHLLHSPPTTDAYMGREFRTMLRRLIDACNAVQFAHEHGVLHRDLKPANIMLGKYGETLVVDWGLAKLISPFEEVTMERDQTTFFALSGSGSTKTRHGAIVGTPMYMSPEQAFGDHDALDGRSDVYSLGAILFNLITGTTPIEGRTSIDVIKNVRSGKIRRIDRLNPVAPKPLASICAKAMALDREQRYENATDLADDIDRWMNDELVLAHAAHENALERVGRLIRRYRSWSISGAAALLMISIIAVGSALLINRARRNEQLAKVQAEKYERDALGRYRDSREAIDKWLVQSSDALEYFPGTQQVRKRLLEQAIDDYERLSESPSADPALELERGRALVRVGELLQMQQDDDSAQRRYRSALEVFENPPGDPALRVAYDAEAAGTRIRIGVSLARQGRRADAEREYLDSIEALSKLAAETADGRARRLLASAHVNAGQFYLDSDIGRAVEQLTNALSTFQSFGEGADDEIRLGTASTQNLLGQIHRDRGDHEKAMEFFQAGIAALIELTGTHPDHPDYLDALASIYVSTASSYRTRGLDGPMFDFLQKAVDAFRALRRSQPGVPRFQENLAIALTDLAIARHEAGLDLLADKTSEESEALLTELGQTYGQSPQILESYALCMDTRGQIQMALHGDAEESLETAEGVLSKLTLTADSDDQVMHLFEKLAITQSHLAQAYELNDKAELAAAKFEESIDRLNPLLAISGPVPRLANAIAHVHYRYGSMLLAADRSKAESQFRLAAEHWMSIEDDSTGSYDDALAWMLVTCPIPSVRDLDAAIEHAQKSVDSAPQNVRYRCTLALAMTLSDDLEGASATLGEIELVDEAYFDRYRFALAMLHHANGNSDEARRAFEAANQWRLRNHRFDADLQLMSERVAEFLDV